MQQLTLRIPRLRLVVGCRVHACHLSPVTRRLVFYARHTIRDDRQYSRQSSCDVLDRRPTVV